MFRGITAVADNGGRFLERLDALNSAAVVFSNDNGCSLGEPGLCARRTAHEESIRIPMRLRHTRGAKAWRIEDCMARNIATAAAFPKLAGAAVTPTLWVET